MGQHMGVEYAEHDDDFSDVTGSEYATGKSPEWIGGVVREAKLRAEAAKAAAWIVQVQAARALMAQGITVREAARHMGVSKSAAARLMWGSPMRREPSPDIDLPVQEMWNDGLRTERERLHPRKGDKSHGYNLHLNLYDAQSPSPGGVKHTPGFTG